MFNFVKVQSVLTVIHLTIFNGQIVYSELISEDFKNSENGKYVVIKNESFFGGNVNKTKFIVTNDNFDQQSEDFSQFEDSYSPDFGSFEQVQEQEPFPIPVPEFQNGRTVTKTYTFYSNNSNSKSMHQVPDQIKYENAANYELVEPEQNVDALSFITQYYYRSIFIGNFDYFNEHWAGIITGNPAGYGAIAVKLSFAFPFYDRYVTDITINSNGFIETGPQVQYKDVPTQYIAPLMANFDVFTTQDSIVYYDDGEKFTVLWENVHLEGDDDNLFFFGVTLYRNGDIVFSYKNIPLTIKSIYEKDKKFKIGISDTYVKENVFDEYRQLSFNNYDITSNSMLWMAILPPVTNTVTQENNPITEVYKNFDKKKESPNNKPYAQEETPFITNTSQLNNHENSDIEYPRTTEEQDIAPEVATETSVTLPDIEPEVLPEVEKINDKSDKTTITDSSTTKLILDNNSESHIDDKILGKNKFEDNSIEPQLDTDKLKYVTHSFYKSVFIGDSLYFSSHWENITKSKSLRHGHRNPHHPENIIKLSFDFPFYDKIIRSIKISNEGFIDLSDKASDIRSNQYVAPLMTNFETKTPSQNLIKNYEDNEKFTTVWDGIVLGDGKMFTFAVTLYHNGDIVFAYKNIPMPIKQVFDNNEETRIGISDSTDDSRFISFKYYDIKSHTILKILAADNINTDKIELASTSPTQVLPAKQTQAATTVKSETSHRRFGGNRNKYTTTNGNVLEDTLVATQTATPKISGKTQKIPETIPKVPNSRRKITGTKQITSENTSELSAVTHEEEKFSQKVIDYQETTLQNGLGNESNISSIFMDRLDTIADLENVQNIVNHNFYQSLLSNNVISFEDHWAEITNQKPLKLPGRSNSRRTDVSHNLTFDFPFYNRNLRNIMITNEGFINIGEEYNGFISTKYIAPLMANFDKKSIRQNSVKLYDDGSKFTALWENVRLLNDKTKIFTFAVTIYKNGDIIFAYKNMPMTVKMISEIDPKVKVGISDISIKDGSITDSNRQISFLSDGITEDTILKLKVKRSCEQDKCDSYGESDSDEQTSLDLTTTNPLLNTVNQDKNTSFKFSDTPSDIESTTKFNNIQSILSVAQNQDSNTTQSIKIIEAKLIDTDSQINENTQKGTENIRETSKITRPLVKITGLTRKITGIKRNGLNNTTTTNSSQVVEGKDITEENQSFSLLKQNSENINTSDETIKINDSDIRIKQYETLIQADREINNLNYKYYDFYKSVFIGSTEYFNDHWENIKKMKPLRQAGRGNTRRSDTIVNLNFDFPFYGRTLRRISVANEGFIATSDRLDQELPSVQYIAPLMINFTNKANSQSSIKLYNDIDKFSALWENLYLQEDKNHKFTFAATLFKNGDIIFAYKNIPISTQELQSRGYKIKMGLNNETLDDNTTHNYISFTSYEIISDSLIKIMTLSSCEIGVNCDSLNNKEVDATELSTTQDPSLEKITQIRNISESTTASVYQTSEGTELTPTDIKSEITSRNRRPIGLKFRDVPLETHITTTTNKEIIEDLSSENETLESENPASTEAILNNHTDFSKNKSLPYGSSLELIRAELDVKNLNYVNHQFYKSAFIGNKEYFNNHWEGIIKSKQIKLAARGNTHRSDINVKVAFGFPFYNQTIRNIKVSVDGFIDTGYKVDKKSDTTWYISPFMTTFDSKINSDSIKLYQDDEKFTAIWENVYFVDDKSDTFTFAVTLYKNGDIIFAYKDIPIKLYDIDEKEHSIKIGMYYLHAEGKDLQDDKRVVLFKKYDISSESVLKLMIIPTCSDGSNCDKLSQDTTEVPTMLSTESTSMKHLISYKNNGITRGRYIVNDSSKNIGNSGEIIEYNIETNGSNSKINTADSRLITEPETSNTSSVFEEKPYEQPGRIKTDQLATTQTTKNEQNSSDVNKSTTPVSISDASISKRTKSSGVRRKIIGTRTKIASDTQSKINIPVDDAAQVPSIVTDKSNKTYQAVKAEQDIKNPNYVNHGLYKSTLIGNVPYFEEHWKLITSSKPLKQAGRSNSRRSDTVVKLTFDFPYFDHIVRNIIVTNEGLINIGDTLKHGLSYSQYIAPLKAPFDNKSSGKSKIRFYDDGEKFTTIWENVYLQEDINKTFTFAVTLYSNGNIIFAYKDIPAVVNEILGGEHQVQIGINDDQNTDVSEEYRHISFTSYDISNNTLLKLISLQTCQEDNSCEDNSKTVTPLIHPIESTSKSNLILQRPTLLQRKPPISATKSAAEAFSFTTEVPEESSQTSETYAISTTVSTGIKNRLIGNRRRVGAYSLNSKLVSNKTVNVYEVTTENITQASTDIEKTSKQNLDTRFDNNTSTEVFESSTMINGLKRKIAGRKDKNTNEIITNPKLDKTSIKNENDVVIEIPGILQSTDAINNIEHDSKNITDLKNIEESQKADFIEAEQNISSLHYTTHGNYRTAFFSDPLYFNEHWNSITKNKPLRQPGRSNTRRSNIPIKLSFDFPYYGHMVRNITVTIQGSILIGNGDDVTNVFSSMQYIAPLMGDFDTKATPQSSMKLYDDNDKFTAVWEKLRLQDDKTKPFTFAVTLYKTGDIIFAYKDIPLSIQTIDDKNKLKIGLSDSKPDHKQSSEISFVSYRILSGSIIKMIIDSSNNQAPIPEPVEKPIEEKSSALETNSSDENPLDNSEIKSEVSEIDSDSSSNNMSREGMPFPVTTIKESNVLSSKIKLLGNKRKPLSTLSKLSYNKPKTINAANDDVAEKKIIVSVDSSGGQSSEVSKEQDPEKDTFDGETKKISLTTALPKLNIRPPKIIGNNLRSINGIKYRKPSEKIDTSTPATLSDIKHEQIILQKPNEDSKSISDSDSQPEVQDDIAHESEQELENQTFAYSEQVTPNPVPSSTSTVSGYKGLKRKSIVSSNSFSSQTSFTKDPGSLTEFKFSSKIKGRRQGVTGITQTLSTVTERQLLTSEYSKGTDFSQEGSVVKSDTLEQNITDKTVIPATSGLKFKINTVRPRPIGKIKQSLEIESKETTKLSSTKNSSSTGFIDLKSDKTSEVAQLIKAQIDISSLNYIYYESYKSTFFSDLEYFSKYWKEITSVNSFTLDSDKSFITVSLSFDFPFYGHSFRDVTVTGKGFIDISGNYDGVQSTHYIAPLMSSFDSNISQSVKIFDDTDKFTVLWENLFFAEDKSKTFTFAVTLHKNGDIVFAYKDINLSLAMIYDLDPETYVGIRDGTETNQISFENYDITSESILKVIKIDSNENTTEVPTRLTTSSPLSVKPLRLSIKTIGKKTLGDTTKIITNSSQAIETNSVIKDAENSSLIVENSPKLMGRRKTSSRRYQLIISTTSKAVISNENQNEFTQPHEIVEVDPTASDITPEIFESGDKAVVESQEAVLEKTLKLPGRRIIAPKRFQPINSIHKTVVLDKNESEIDALRGVLSKENTEGQKSAPFLQNTFTRKVTRQRNVVGKRLQLVSSTTESIVYDENSDPRTESSPENHEIINNEKVTSGLIAETIVPIVKTGEQFSTFVEDSYKTTSRGKISGKRYQLLGTASKFTAPSIQAKLKIPTVGRNQDVSEIKQMTSDLLAEPIKDITKSHKITEEQILPGESSIVAESTVELPILEQEGASVTKTSADPVKNWVINQRSQRRRQKLVLRQS